MKATPLSRWLFSIPPKDRQFIQDYGAVAKDSDLAHLLKWSRPQVNVARRSLGIVPAQQRFARRRVNFAALFEAYHARPPGRRDSPPLRRFHNGYEWNAAQDKRLTELWGLLPAKELATELTSLLQTITGDSEAVRTYASALCRATGLGLSGAYQHGTRGVPLLVSARRDHVPYRIVHHESRRNNSRLKIFGRGHYRYVTWDSWKRWLKDYRAAQKSVRDELDSLPEPCTNTVGARKILGVGESHLGRFLKGKVVRAWKIDNAWHISIPHLKELAQKRKRGELGLDTPEYQALKQRANEQHRAWNRLQRQEGGHTRYTPPPGWVTPSMLSSQCRTSRTSIYEAIETDRLKATRAPDGRLLIAEDDALKFAGGFSEAGYIQRREARLHEEIHRRGGLTHQEGMKFLGRGWTQMIRYAQKKRLHPFKVGNRRGYLKQELEALRQDLVEHPEPVGRSATIQQRCPAGYVPISEAARRLGQPNYNVRQRVQAGELRSKRVAVGRMKLTYVSERALERLLARHQ